MGRYKIGDRVMVKKTGLTGIIENVFYVDKNGREYIQPTKQTK